MGAPLKMRTRGKQRHVSAHSAAGGGGVDIVILVVK